MTYETPEKPSNIILLVAAGTIGGVIALWLGEGVLLVANILMAAAGLWSVWRVGRWLWASARLHAG